MSKINRLIQEFCPNGVEFKNFKEIALKITTGKLNANAKSENGVYPFYTCDAEPFRINTYAFDTEAILVSGNGSQVGHVNYYHGKFNAYQRTYVISDFQNANVKYLLHYLNGNLRKYIFENSRKGSVPYITLPMLQTFQIPIPPLEVQEEIVRILDTFTELEAELEAELEVRRKQFEFFRDIFLGKSPDSLKNSWNLKTLDQIATNLDSKRKPITKGLRSEGKYPYYGASGIVDYVDGYIFDGEYLLISEDGANLLARNTPIAFSISGKNWVNNHAHVIRFEDANLRKFVEYYLNSISLTPYISGAAQPKLNKQNLNQIQIPIPSHDELPKIVNAMSSFDALVNDTEIGLPAELAARRKQYEYYRNKLLTFEKKSA